METDDAKTKERPEKVSFHIEIVKDEFILPMMAGNLKVEQELEDVLINIVNVKEEVEDEVIPIFSKNTYGAPKFIPLKHFKYIPAKNHSIALVRDSVSC